MGIDMRRACCPRACYPQAFRLTEKLLCPSSRRRSIPASEPCVFLRRELYTGASLPFSVNRCLIDLLLSGCGCPHAKRPHDRFTLNPTCDRQFKHAIQLHDERARFTLRRSSAHRLPSFLLRQQPQQPPFSQPRLSLRPLSSQDPRQVFF